jgi:hypothetical protein
VSHSIAHPTATQLPKYQSLISTIKESPSRSAGVGHRRDTPQLQHNMWVLAIMRAVFSVITRGGKRVEIQAHANRFIGTSSLLPNGSSVAVSKVASPRPFGVDPPKARIEAIVSDEFVVSPCHGHHHDVHAYTAKPEWWRNASIAPSIAARAPWLDTHLLLAVETSLPVGAACSRESLLNVSPCLDVVLSS